MRLKKKGRGLTEKIKNKNLFVYLNAFIKAQIPQRPTTTYTTVANHGAQLPIKTSTALNPITVSNQLMAPIAARTNAVFSYQLIFFLLKTYNGNVFKYLSFDW